MRRFFSFLQRLRPLVAAAALAVGGVVAAAAWGQTASIPGLVEVFSDAAEYQGRRSVFSGNVTLAAGRMTLSADRLEVEVGEAGNIYRAVGMPVRIACAECFGAGTSAEAGEVRYDAAAGVATAVGGAQVCAGANCENGKLTAGELEWRRGANVFIARATAPAGDDAGKKGGGVGGSGSVSLIWNPPDGERVAVSAREIRYDFRAGTAELRGDAAATRGGSSLRGERIFYDRRSGAMRAEAAEAGGRVRAVFGVDDGGGEEGEGGKEGGSP